MYNRFEISKDVFLKNKNTILDRITYFKNNGYKSYFHIIVPGLEKEIIDQMYENKEILGHILIYNEYINVTKNTTKESCGMYKYILNISGIPDTFVINSYYIQQIEGYSAIYPTTNLIVKLDDKLDMYINDKYIANLLGDISIPNIKNFYMGEKRCSKCLNCMCDITKTKNTIFLIDPEECQYKSKLKDIVSKEVKEVTREEYANLMESMSHLLRENSINSELIIQLLQGDING